MKNMLIKTTVKDIESSNKNKNCEKSSKALSTKKSTIRFYGEKYILPTNTKSPRAL